VLDEGELREMDALAEAARPMFTIHTPEVAR
jgi:hypothetical protein